MVEPTGLSTAELHAMTLFRISRSFRVVTGLAQQRLQAIGLTDVQFRVLNATCALEDPNVADVVIYSDLRQPVVSQALKQLETKGLVTRVVDVNDGRARRLAPTPEGARRFALGSDELRAVEADLNRRLGPSATDLRSSLDLLLATASGTGPSAETPRAEAG